MISQQAVEELKSSSGPRTGVAVVGGTAGVVLDGSAPVINTVKLKAASGNSGTIFIGGENSTAASDTATLGGYPLAKGEELELQVTDVNVIWAISDASGQHLHWLAN